MTIAVRSLTVSDFDALKNVADGVFDDPLVPSSAKSFLKNQDNYLVVAVDEDNADRVVGFASAVKYLHPDKEKPEMVVLEIGVAPPYRQQGAGKKIMNAISLKRRKPAVGSRGWPRSRIMSPPLRFIKRPAASRRKLAFTSILIWIRSVCYKPL
ncbi:MAG: GNAT family N-acetyltransferase [Marinicaulis sp.]|nr:GNAT family N-acetyltransferase [Marinicaulis sp.]